VKDPRRKMDLRKERELRKLDVDKRGMGKMWVRKVSPNFVTGL